MEGKNREEQQAVSWPGTFSLMDDSCHTSKYHPLCFPGETTDLERRLGLAQLCLTQSSSHWLPLLAHHLQSADSRTTHHAQLEGPQGPSRVGEPGPLEHWLPCHFYSCSAPLSEGLPLRSPERQLEPRGDGRGPGIGPEKTAG